VKKRWAAQSKHDWSPEGYWASYSDLMAGILLVFAVAAAAARIDLIRGVLEPTKPLRDWQEAATRLCSDPGLKDEAVQVDCSTGTLLISEKSLRYDLSSTELKPAGREVLARIVPRYLDRYLEVVCAGKSDCSQLQGIEISGHTDATGDRGVNDIIGSERARRVLEYMRLAPEFEKYSQLISDKGFTSGFADTRPPHGEYRRDGQWDEARRIEIQVRFDAETVLQNLNKAIERAANRANQAQ
jgi:outer membrane protein OmpA-like peptidoglycan-associated protein